VALRLLQFSDVHLDSNLAGSALGLPPSKRARRAQETREALRRALDLAQSDSVQLVLIAGDLWDDEAVSVDTVSWVADALGSIAPVPVFIAPGNHDYYGPGSGYDPGFLAGRGLPPWPDNVHIFGDSRFQTVEVPGLEGVTVTGRAFLANTPGSERPLAGRISRPRAELALALLHGSRIGHEGGKQLITAPFSDAELLGQGFAYVALGHYHRHSCLEDARGRVRAAYSGSLVGRTLAETGLKGALLAEVEPSGVVAGSLRFVELDGRRVVRAEADVTGSVHSDGARKLVETALEAAEARKQDQVFVHVTGRYPHGLEPPALEPMLADRYFHLRVVWDALPDYDLKSLTGGQARTVEARFAQELAARLEGAEDDDQRAVLEEALYMGLDAVTQGRVLVRERCPVEEAET
jgi:DNA repair exonuclease SbcCD nuclease subunit